MGWLTKRLGYGIYGTIDSNNPNDSPHVTLDNVPAGGSLSEAIINFSASGDNNLVAGVIGQSVKVYRLFLIVNGATSITFKDGTTGLTGTMDFVKDGFFKLDISSSPWFTTSSGNGFVINQSGTAQISGRIYYVQS